MNAHVANNRWNKDLTKVWMQEKLYPLHGHGLVQFVPHRLVDIAKHEVAREYSANSLFFCIVQVADDCRVGR